MLTIYYPIWPLFLMGWRGIIQREDSAEAESMFRKTLEYSAEVEKVSMGHETKISSINSPRYKCHQVEMTVLITCFGRSHTQTLVFRAY